MSDKDMEELTMTQAELAKKFVEDMAPVDAKSEGFVIDDMGKARWAVDKIAEKRAEIDEIEKFAQMQINQIMAWAQRQKESANFEIGHFECLLEQFAQKELADKKTKTLKLPNGRLVMGRKTVAFKKNDESLMAFVKENHKDFIKVKETVDWAEFKKTLRVEDGKAIDENGEIVPDIEVTEVEGKFEVKLGF